MARSLRIQSSSGIYHIMMRGIDKQIIFNDDEDRAMFINKLKHYKDKYKFLIFAFVIMDNHIHLIIKENDINISNIIKDFSSAYVNWYNLKYERVGSLFQDRFKSEAIENDEYLLSCIRYIHQNPVKASLAQSINEYYWSSYNYYIGKNTGLISSDYVLKYFDDIEQFIVFMNDIEDNVFIDYNRSVIITETKLDCCINNFLRNDNVDDIKQLTKDNLNKLIITMLNLDVSIRKIESITGINRWTIEQIKRGIK